MATTVKVLAKELKRTAPDLLEQLKAAGIEKGSEDDSITEKDRTLASAIEAHAEVRKLITRAC